MTTNASHSECGGCVGLGAHRRWCKAVVGRGAAFLGELSVKADNLADTVGSNDPGASNHLYAAAGLLRERAAALAAEFRQMEGAA
jgi:hypothetical protein